MLSNWNDTFASRLTNNVVENYFGFLKNVLLQKQRKVFPSELVSKLMNLLTSLYIENYSDQTDSCFSKTHRNKGKKSNRNHIPNEYWNSRKSMTDTRPNKGFHYQCQDIFAEFDEDSYLLDEINEEFIEYFSDYCIDFFPN